MVDNNNHQNIHRDDRARPSGILPSSISGAPGGIQVQVDGRGYESHQARQAMQTMQTRRSQLPPQLGPMSLMNPQHHSPLAMNGDYFDAPQNGQNRSHSQLTNQTTYYHSGQHYNSTSRNVSMSSHDQRQHSPIVHPIRQSRTQVLTSQTPAFTTTITNNINQTSDSSYINTPPSIRTNSSTITNPFENVKVARNLGNEHYATAGTSNMGNIGQKMGQSMGQQMDQQKHQIYNMNTRTMNNIMNKKCLDQHQPQQSLQQQQSRPITDNNNTNNSTPISNRSNSNAPASMLNNNHRIDPNARSKQKLREDWLAGKTNEKSLNPSKNGVKRRAAELGKSEKNNRNDIVSNSASSVPKRETKGRKTLFIPGLDGKKTKSEIAGILDGILSLWNKINTYVKDFQASRPPSGVSNTNIVVAAVESTNKSLEDIMKLSKGKSNASQIKTRLTNEKEVSLFAVLSSIESELSSLLDLTAKLVKVLENCSKNCITYQPIHQKCETTRTQIASLQKDIRARMSETKLQSQRIRKMAQNADIKGRLNVSSPAQSNLRNMTATSGTKVNKRKSASKATNDIASDESNNNKKKKPVSNDKKRRRKDDSENLSKKNTLLKPTAEAQPDTTQRQSEGKKRSIGPVVKIRDDYPSRITNPLLEMPHYQTVPKGFLTPGSLPLESIPQGAEFWKIMPLYFPRPDTFPLSYIAKILGFDASLINQSIENTPKQIDYSALQLKKCNKNDKWMQIPLQSKFSEHLKFSKTSSLQNNITLDEVDPMWTAILEQYRGHRDDLYKPSSEINKENVICSDCISFAKRLKLLNEEINFRQATLNDSMSLNNFSMGNEKNEGVYDSSFSNALKCGNQFIILAESKNVGIIGYVHYRFCWFRPKFNRPGTTIDILQGTAGSASTTTNPKSSKTMAERILHIENVQSSDESNSKPGFETDLVLVSLAIQHARRFVVYGVMDTASNSVFFYKNYFRMSEIAKKNSQEGDERVFLAIDLEGCSYRYAFLKKEQEMCRDDQATSIATQGKSERMLVILPSVQELDTDPCRIKPTSDASYIYESDDIKHVTSREKHSRIKKIVVKVDQAKGSLMGSGKDATPKKISSEKCVDTRQINWTFLRSFPKHSSRLTAKEEVGTNSQKERSTTVVAELERLQKQLSTDEKELLPTLWSLYNKSYAERKKFELESVKGTQMKSALKQYNRILERRQEEQKAWELQQEQEENAVCDICGDGESTGENRIIFCDSCNISVHQHCYGIAKVPSEDYFCHACLYFKRDKSDSTTLVENRNPQRKNDKKPPLPIHCEVCPRRQGAFIQTHFPTRYRGKTGHSSKWVHVVCAKWHGFQFYDPSTDQTLPHGNMVEDITEFKNQFRINETKCCLCLGMRGCFIKCREEDCDKWMHVTCARSSGLCEVNHGSNHLGMVESEKAWTLACPDHSTIDPESTPAGTAHLQALAKTFPVEPPPLPPPKPFYKMTKKERDHHLADPEYEEEIIETLMKKVNSARCEVCFHQPCSHEFGSDVDEMELMRCHICGANAHAHCLTEKWKVEKIRNSSPRITCSRCLYVEEHKSDDYFKTPECHMCNYSQGTLVKAKAIPMSMRKWKANPSAYRRSYFGRQIWCHPICGMWHPKCHVDDDGVINCTNVIMSNGISHIESKTICYLCGKNNKVKVQCNHCSPNSQKACQLRFHLTCARQAGLEVSDIEHSGETEFSVKCFQHSRCQFALRAVLEDMIEVERNRTCKGLMSLECAANIFNWGVVVMNCLGWAWKWSEWWVHLGDTWEPLLEKGQKEDEMTKEELRIIDSTPESRCMDARKCRLAAFGAALRNRDYDKEEGDDRKPLERALRAVLSTPSLVGPLKKVEIDFFVDWLARVYRSHSPQLGFGDNKIPVMEEYEEGSLNHFHDKSPKYILGDRRLPGKQNLAKGQTFETDFSEVDDFCHEEIPLSIILRRRETTKY